MKKLSKTKLEVCLNCRAKFKPLDKLDLICNPCQQEDKIQENFQIREEVAEISSRYFTEDYE